MHDDKVKYSLNECIIILTSHDLAYAINNCEYFVVKIFLDSLAYVKIKCAETYVCAYY